MRPKPAARDCRKPSAKPSRRATRSAGKRQGPSSVRPHPTPKTAGNSGDNSTLQLAPGLPDPWSDLEFELRDRGTREHSLLQITDRGIPIDQLVLHPKQTTLVRFLFAKTKENAMAPRDERLASSEELLH